MNNAIAAVGSTLSWVAAVAISLVLLALFVLGGLPSRGHRRLSDWAPGWPSRLFAQISSWIEFLVSIGLFRLVARRVEDPERAVILVALAGILAVEGLVRIVASHYGQAKTCPSLLVALPYWLVARLGRTPTSREPDA